LYETEKYMRLSDLEKYRTITIQCHDNPDADTIAAGYALLSYFQDKHCEVRLIYSGRNKISKANLKMMIDKLEIPIQFIPPHPSKRVEGLLLMVDCQYGAGNVTCFEADHVAVIDHHLAETEEVEYRRIDSRIGSCATLVWDMLREEQYPVDEDIALGTALYYGLYTDTNQFSELFNPLDMEMREKLTVNKRLINQFRNSNLSLKELEIAGVALLRYSYNEDYHFAVIKAQPCDPNVLGLISDFLIQVAEIDTCVVYNEINDGFKFSVRSCVREVNANELAIYLSETIGSGGGHYEKAGGFISMKLYDKLYPLLHSEAYFTNRMIEYFETFSLVFASSMQLDLATWKQYVRKPIPICYIKATDVVSEGTRMTLSTHRGLWECVANEELIFMLERNGDIYPMGTLQFETYLKPLPDQVCEAYYEQDNFMATIKDWSNDAVYPLGQFVKTCIPTDAFKVYAQPLENSIKLFPVWDEERYLLGKRGDYMAISVDNPKNIFIVSGDAFTERYIEA